MAEQYETCGDCGRREVKTFGACPICRARQTGREAVTYAEQSLHGNKMCRNALNRIAEILERSDVIPKAISSYWWGEVNIYPEDRKQAFLLCGQLGKLLKDKGNWIREQEGSDPMLRFSGKAMIQFDEGVWDGEIRIRDVEVPASCKIEYEEVEVPARIERHARIVCKEE